MSSKSPSSFLQNVSIGGHFCSITDILSRYCKLDGEERLT